MNIQSIIILAVILVAALAVSVHLFKNREKCSCSSCNGNCSYCKNNSEK